MLLLTIVLTACTGGGGKPGPSPSYSVWGTVTDRNRAGIEGVTISYQGEQSGVKTTGSDGQYRLEGLRGSASIAASKDGWSFGEPKVVNQESTVNFLGERITRSLSVTVSGQGKVTRNGTSSEDIVYEYEYGTTVELEAVPTDYWLFSHWDGNLSGTANPATVDVIEDLAIKAVFVPETYAVSGIVADENGNGISDVIITYQGGLSGNIKTASDGRFELEGLHGPVTFSASKEGWLFGPPQKTDGQGTVNFTGTRKTYPLSVTIIGEGKVHEEVLLSTQGTEYEHGTSVQLEAIPDDHWVFSRWEGDLAGTDNPAVLTVESETKVTAVFERHIFAISGTVLDETGAGLSGVTITYQGEKSGAVITSGTGQYAIQGLWGPTLIAASKEGWTFSEPRTVTETGTVDFTGRKNIYSLAVDVTGQGKVADQFQDLAPGAKYEYEHGAPVGLTASPDGGWVFSHWEGDITGMDNPFSFTMTDHMHITAVFTDYTTITGTVQVEHNFPGSVLDRYSSHSGQYSFVQPSLPLPLAQDGLAEGDSDELIIGFDAGMTHAEQIKILESLGYQVLDSLEILNSHLVRAEAGQDQFQALSVPGITYLEPNKGVSKLGATYPNDDRYRLQWHYPLIRLPQAWSITQGDSSIRIAVLDTGVRPDHPDLQPHLDAAYGYNFIDYNYDFSDHNGHGTHVAGTIGAVTNNSLGVAGVMWSVDILPIKVLPDSGRGDMWTLATGILYAAGLLDEPGKPRNPHRADVINLSLGGDNAEVVHQAVKAAADSGSLLVASAGNEAAPVRYPAAYPEVIAVGAVDYNYHRMPYVAHFSNYGPELDVAAPGGQSNGILSTSLAPEDYAFMQGTSMAAPHVTGLIGLMLSAGIPREQVRDILHQTSMPLGPDLFSPNYGYGLINAYWAVNAVDEIKILLGTREGDRLDIVAETAIGLRDGNFVLDNVPPGKYQVFAWIDIQKDGNSPEPGDYFAETELLEIRGDHSHTLSLTHRELGSIN